jgi:hypothetical protein
VRGKQGEGARQLVGRGVAPILLPAGGGADGGWQILCTPGQPGKGGGGPT